MVIPKRYVHVLESVNVALFGKRVFADIIKDLEMRSSGLLASAPNPTTNVPIKDTQRRDRDGHVQTEERLE